MSGFDIGLNAEITQGSGGSRTNGGDHRVAQAAQDCIPQLHCVGELEKVVNLHRGSEHGDVNFFGPVGGRALLVLNQEARVPIYKWLRGVGFVDAGNVFTQPSGIRLDELAGSIGFGLRLSTPFALLRADYGKVVWGAGVRSRGFRLPVDQAAF